MSDDGWEDDGWGGQEDSTTAPEVAEEVGADGDGASPEEAEGGGGGRGSGDNKCRNCKQVGLD